MTLLKQRWSITLIVLQIKCEHILLKRDNSGGNTYIYIIYICIATQIS